MLRRCRRRMPPSPHRCTPRSPPRRTRSSRSNRLPTVEMEPRTRAARDRDAVTDVETLPPAPPTKRANRRRRERQRPYCRRRTARIIYARYLRSGRWVPVRDRRAQPQGRGAADRRAAARRTITSMSRSRSAAIARSCAARSARCRRSARRARPARRRSRSSSSSTRPSRRQLTALLTAARAANVTIKPPPPRVDAPVPGRVAGGARHDARRGPRRGARRLARRHVRAPGRRARCSDSNLNFSVVLDDGGAPIAGRAQVVRQISDAEARAAGCSRATASTSSRWPRPIACAGSRSSRGSSGAPTNAS